MGGAADFARRGDFSRFALHACPAEEREGPLWGPSKRGPDGEPPAAV